MDGLTGLFQNPRVLNLLCPSDVLLPPYTHPPTKKKVREKNLAKEGYWEY